MSSSAGKAVGTKFDCAGRIDPHLNSCGADLRGFRLSALMVERLTSVHNSEFQFCAACNTAQSQSAVAPAALKL
jgi:hypothetical protein